MKDAEREARRRQRAGWQIRRVSLEDERAPDVSALSPNERVAMVWRLTLDAWAISNRPMPTYSREEAPGRVLRRDDE